MFVCIDWSNPFGGANLKCQKNSNESPEWMNSKVFASAFNVNCKICDSFWLLNERSLLFHVLFAFCSLVLLVYSLNSVVFKHLHTKSWFLKYLLYRKKKKHVTTKGNGLLLSISFVRILLCTHFERIFPLFCS